MTRGPFLPAGGVNVRWLSFGWLVVGVALLAGVARDIDAHAVWRALVEVGWRSALLIPIALVWVVPNTIAWGFAFNPPGPRFWPLFEARIAGESLNDLLPSSNLGGEPVKALLLKPFVDFAEALSSVTVAKTTQTIAIFLFLAVGLGLSSSRADLPKEVDVAAAGVLALLGGGSAVLVFGSTSGLLARSARRVHGLFGRSDSLSPWAKSLVDADAILAGYFQRHRGRFAASTAWHLAGLVGGALEIYLIGRFLDLPLTPWEAVIMEVVTTLFGVGGFLIPGSIGAFEFGHVLAASMFGLPAHSGMSMSLLRRFREVIWLLAGLGVLWARAPGVWRGIELDGGDVGVREGR